MGSLPKETVEKILQLQQLEISEYQIYKNLTKRIKTQETKKVLTHLADDSLKHYQYWQKISQKEVPPDKFRVWFYSSIGKVFGLTFGVKVMENTEEAIRNIYEELARSNKEFAWIIDEEKKHEKEVVGLINEDLLKYMGSIVLGSSDALVELTGTLAGLTLALQNNQLIGATGLITGLAASLSMASSEYLSTKSEKTIRSPMRASLYTGITYVMTVILLISPYFISRNYYLSLALTLANAALIIFFFSLYTSITQDVSFKKRFLENLSLSFGVAFLSFFIGLIVRNFLHLEI